MAPAQAPTVLTSPALLDLPPVLCFIDVETTGMSPQRGRVTEVGILRVEDWAGPAPQLTQWSSLVNPEEAIPQPIQALTGITPEMVREAPRFEAIAGQVLALSADAIFVAHQARFDYGFIKAEMERCGQAFQARTLCTVRLSQALFPDTGAHGLDALIARHQLPCSGRHRALGDAQVLWSFLQVLMGSVEHPALALVLRKLMRHPSLPAHLPPDQLQQLPRTPGVYKFYGLNKHPLYIGKSISLRDRIGEHFCVDHRSERGMRLAQEIRRIEWEQCAGDFGARLREIVLIHQEMPAHNIALRKREQALWISIDPDTAQIGHHPCHEPAPEGLDLFGPFVSKAAARHHLTGLAREAHLCLQTMGLEKRSRRERDNEPLRPCFNHQIARCKGACCGLETASQLAARLADALAPRRRPPWVWGPLCIEEPATDYPSLRFHHFDQWCWLGSSASDASAAHKGDEANQAAGRFDLNLYHLLRPLLADATPGEQAGSAQADGPVSGRAGWRLMLDAAGQALAAPLLQAAA